MYLIPLSALEERTLGTIEKATSRLQDGDRKLKLADGKMMNLEQELMTAQVRGVWDAEDQGVVFKRYHCSQQISVLKQLRGGT